MHSAFYLRLLKKNIKRSQIQSKRTFQAVLQLPLSSALSRSRPGKNLQDVHKRTKDTECEACALHWVFGLGEGDDSKLQLTPHQNLELVSRMGNSDLPRNKSFRNCPFPLLLFQFCKSNSCCSVVREVCSGTKRRRRLSSFSAGKKHHQISVLISGYKSYKGEYLVGVSPYAILFFFLHLLYLTDGHNFSKVYNFWITVT